MGDANAAHVAEIERLAELTYGPNSTQQQRNEAMHLSKALYVSPEHLQTLGAVLQTTNSIHAMIMATSAFTKVIEKFHNSMTPDALLQFRALTTHVIMSRADVVRKTVPFRRVCALPARLSKLGWAKDARFHNYLGELIKLVSSSENHCYATLLVLKELVQEMNTLKRGQSITQHRKIAVMFRDKQLRSVFHLLLDLLSRVAAGQLGSLDIRTEIFELMLSVLSYDFIGTNPDESSIDFGSVQVPANWKSYLEPVQGDVRHISMLVQLFSSSPPRVQQTILECLNKLALCRRSLFSGEDARNQYLQVIMRSSVRLFQESPQAIMEDSENAIKFCRLLCCMKTNYQLSHIVRVPFYNDWIKMVLEFTRHSFSAQHEDNKLLFYLVNLWSRLTMSIPYLREKAPEGMQSAIPDVVQAFIDHRFKALKEGAVFEDLFEDNALSEQLQHCSAICRYQYERTYEIIRTRFFPTLEEYKQRVQQRMYGDGEALLENEGQLAWLVYVIAAVSTGTPTPGHNNREQARLIDGRLSAMVFQVIEPLNMRVQQVNQMRLAGQLAQLDSDIVKNLSTLDKAVITFFEKFHRTHIVYQNTRPLRGRDQEQPAIYRVLSETLKIDASASNMLTHIINKIKFNFMNYPNEYHLIERSLDLLLQISQGFESFKLLVKLDTAKDMLSQHAQWHVAEGSFLTQDANMKLRTKFYQILGRIVFSDEHFDNFDQFMMPFSQMLDWIEQQNPESPQVQRRMVGLCRDLRGICQSAMRNYTYLEFFEWWYPDGHKVFSRLFEVYWGEPKVAIPMLRFMSELVTNTLHRISFDESSPNGIYLFRAASQIIQKYSARILQTNVDDETDSKNADGTVSTLNPMEALYKKKYKGISIVVEVMTHALGGQFVSFGIFKVFPDNSLSSALGEILKLIASVPMFDLLAYRKVSARFFALIEILFRQHMDVIVGSDSFCGLLQALPEGLGHVDHTQSSMAAVALDHLCTFVFKQRRKKKRRDNTLEKLEAQLQTVPEYFHHTGSTILSMLVFSNPTNQWTLARPVCSMILINEDILKSYVAWLAASQSPAVHPRLEKAMNELLSALQTKKLDVSTREKFTTALLTFRKDVGSFCSRPAGLDLPE